jgi:hypothetical protein
MEMICIYYYIKLVEVRYRNRLGSGPDSQCYVGTVIDTIYLSDGIKRGFASDL